MKKIEFGGSISVEEITRFVDEGGNLLVTGGPNLGQAVRELALQHGFEFDEPETMGEGGRYRHKEGCPHIVDYFQVHVVVNPIVAQYNVVTIVVASCVDEKPIFSYT
ncbi:hypothetical protein ANCCAN_25780 [Ancylostoma caninum]|uniref:OST48 N-terminal domain-containing protein n=1 Tax=Ancylostoma caninum TaxID=29170 RepID=A0A368FC45_ANCCA|nr:hypothetical protein ANCCAN_25780 [Ancylostoma caninum]